MDALNNREIATLFWILAILTSACFVAPIRGAFCILVKVFIRKQIVYLFLFMLIYIVIIVICLYLFGLWDHHQLKNTIIWTSTVALGSIVRLPQMMDEPDYFSHTIHDSFRLIIILEFIINFYTASLLFELFIIPIVSVLLFIQRFVEDKKELSPLKLPLDLIVAIFGFSVLGYSLYNIFVHFGDFAELNTLFDFLTPVLLTLCLIPFLYILTLYSSYENVFHSMHFAIKDDNLRRYAKRVALLRFHLRRNLLKRWRRDINIIRPENRKEVDASIALIKKLAAREVNPPIVPAHLGWSPYVADKFLTSEGIVCTDYRKDPLHEGRWYCDSHHIGIDDDSLGNTIVYYLEGSEHAAQRLKLVADCYDDNDINTLLKRFSELAHSLLQKASFNQNWHDVRLKILELEEFSLDLDEVNVQFSIEKRSSDRGCKLHFEIIHP